MTGYTVNDGNGGADYTVTTATAAGTITPAALTISATTDSKVYDGTTASSKTPTTSTLYDGDTVTASQAFLSKNVMGTNSSTLVVTGYTVNDGNGGADYTVTTATAAGTITPAALTIFATTDSKVYDGTTTSSKTPTTSTLYDGDTVTASQAFTSKNVLGTGASTLVVTGYTVNDGNGGADYTVTTATATGTITPAALTIYATGDSKVYNGTTTSSKTPTTSTLYDGDTVTASQAFASKNVLGAGGSTLVVSGYTINDGNGGKDYTVTTATATGTITPAALTISATTDSKFYDGTTASAKAPTTSTLYDGDTVTASQAFSSKNVLGAGGSTLLVTGYTVNDGDGGADYTVTTQAASGTINAATVTVSAVSDSKYYDGTTSSSQTPTFQVTSYNSDLSESELGASTLYPGDSYTSLTQVFDSPNPGSRALSVATDNFGPNYTVVGTPGAATGTIYTVSISGNPTVNEGTPNGSNPTTSVFTLNLSSNGPANSWTINWGDGGIGGYANPDIQTITGNPSTVTHVYALGAASGTSYTITAGITDSAGFHPNLATTSVKVLNVAPTASIGGPASALVGQYVTFTGTFFDQGLVDLQNLYNGTGGSLTWQVTNSSGKVVAGGSTGNGTAFTAIDSNLLTAKPQSQFSFALAATGTYTVSFRVQNQEGAIVSIGRTVTVTSAAVSLTTDPTNPGETALLIVSPSTAGRSELIVVTPTSSTGAGIYTVKMGANASSLTTIGTTYRPNGHIIVYGGAGNDTVELLANGTNKVTTPAVIFGGTAGNTSTTKVLDASGSSGNNILVGATGASNILYGGSGYNILIGGNAQGDGYSDDFNEGGTHGQQQLGNDLVIRSSTVYDNNAAALVMLMNEWDTATPSNLSAVEAVLSSDYNGYALIAGTGGTVGATNTSDQVFESGDDYWLF